MQLKSSTAAQEQSLKGQLQSVQEQAQQHIQDVSAQLQAKGAAIEEKEREAGEQRRKLEGEIAALQQQLLARNEELQSMERVAKEVSTIATSVPLSHSIQSSKKCFLLQTSAGIHNIYSICTKSAQKAFVSQQNLQNAKSTEEGLQGEVEQLRQQHSREKLALQGEINSASSQLASTESQLKSVQQELEGKTSLLQERERVSVLSVLIYEQSLKV